MRQAIIYTTEKDYEQFIALAKSLRYVKKIETDEGNRQSEKLQGAEENIRAGLEEVRLFKEGKLATTPATDFLNEI